MEKKPDQELHNIVEDARGFDESARLAAAWELEKRGKATDYTLIALKNIEQRRERTNSPQVFRSKSGGGVASPAEQQEELAFNPFPKTNTLAMASGTKRFINFIIDYLAAIAFGVVVMISIGIVAGLLGFEYVLEEEYPFLENVLWFFWYSGYYIFFEFAVGGKTIGKMITRTRVVDEDGNKPDFSNIVGRSLARFIPFEMFSFLGSDARGWHDSLSATVVIDETKSVLRSDWV